MGALEYSQAALRICGDDLIPEDISNLLGAKPTSKSGHPSLIVLLRLFIILCQIALYF